MPGPVLLVGVCNLFIPVYVLNPAETPPSKVEPTSMANAVLLGGAPVLLGGGGVIIVGNGANGAIGSNTCCPS